MTAPNPIHVVPVPGIAEELRAAFAPYLDLMEKNRAARQLQEQIDISERQQKVQEGDLKLRQEELKLKQDQAAHELEVARQSGLAIQAMIAGAGAFAPPTNVSAGPQYSRFGTPMPGQPAAQQGPETPEQTIGRVIGSLDPGTVQEALKEGKIDVGAILAKRQAKMEFSANVDEAAKRLPASMQTDFRTLSRILQVDPNITPAEAKTIAPSLFPSTIDPALMNSVWNVMQGGWIDMGQARSLAGIKDPIPGIPDSFRLPRAPEKLSDSARNSMPGFFMLRHSLPRQEAAEIALGLKNHDIYHPDHPISATDKRMIGNVGLPWSGRLRETLNTDATTGGWGIQLGAQVIRHILDRFTSDPDLPPMFRYDPATTQMLNQSLETATAIKFALSGKQATLNETLTFMDLVTPYTTDDPETQLNKMTFARTMLGAINMMVLDQAPSQAQIDQILMAAEKVPGATEAVTEAMSQRDTSGQGAAGQALPPDSATAQQQADTIVKGRALPPPRTWDEWYQRQIDANPLSKWFNDLIAKGDSLTNLDNINRDLGAGLHGMVTGGSELDSSKVPGRRPQ